MSNHTIVLRCEEWNTAGHKKRDETFVAQPGSPIHAIMMGPTYAVHIFSKTGSETHYTKVER